MATANEKRNRYVVDLGSLKLTDEDNRAIASAIQGAVLAQLASIKAAELVSFDLIDKGKIRGMYAPGTGNGGDYGSGTGGGTGGGKPSRKPAGV